jgi:uncharacterized protein DUF3455
MCSKILASLVWLSGCAASVPPASRLEVPSSLQVPGDQALALEARARGVQIYECRAAKDAAKFEWTLKGPEAELLDGAGKPIGRHYAGPTWEASDGSKVVGEVKAKDAGPDPTAVPWLLLTAKSAEGSGVLGRTASIQRLATVGGKAPAEGCSAEHDGAVVRIDYQATYRFYRRD